jgi:hypothetical protein
MLALVLASVPLAVQGYSTTDLTSPNPSLNGEFGWSVAASGDLVVVGAPAESPTGWTDSGNAYVFNAQSGSLITTLANPSPQNDSKFGWSVAIDGNTAVVGAPGENTGKGAAYVLNALTGAPIFSLASPNQQIGGHFGYSVAVSGGNAVVGAYNESVGSNSTVGSAYIFNTKSGALVATLTSPNPFPLGEFGWAVAMTGSTVVVGAPHESAGQGRYAGNAYLFDAQTGILSATLNRAGNWASGLALGSSVAVSGNTVVVGAPSTTFAGVQTLGGYVDVYDAQTGSQMWWMQGPYTDCPNPSGTEMTLCQNSLDFAEAVGVSGDVMAVGASGAQNSYNGPFAGDAWLMNTDQSGRQMVVSPNQQEGGDFGEAVAMAGCTVLGGSCIVVVGAPYEAVGSAFNSAAGHAYVFQMNPPTTSTTTSSASSLTSSATQTTSTSASSLTQTTESASAVSTAAAAVPGFTLSWYMELGIGALAAVVVACLILAYTLQRRGKKAWQSAPAPPQVIGPSPPTGPADATPSPPPTEVSMETLDKLAKLKALLESGVLTQAEYESMKAATLAANPAPQPMIFPTTAPPWVKQLPPISEEQADKSAIGKTAAAGMLQLFAVVLSFMGVFYVSSYMSSYANCVANIIQQGSCSTGFDFSSIAYQTAVPAVGGILSLASFALIRSAFSTLKRVDRRFSSPTTLTSFVYAAIALFVVGTFIGAVIVLGTLYSPSGSTADLTTMLMGVYIGIAIAGLGGILALVGEVGFLLGIWRLGNRYHTSLFKAAALFGILGALLPVGVAISGPPSLSSVASFITTYLGVVALVSAVPPVLVLSGVFASRRAAYGRVQSPSAG